jgi:hypothetical protein
VFFCFLAKWCPYQFASETHKEKGQFGDFHHNCKQPCNEMILQRMAFEPLILRFDDDDDDAFLLAQTKLESKLHRAKAPYHHQLQN